MNQGEPLNELALFAGAGGGILGGHLLGWRCVCAVEYDKYARNVLLARQRDGHLPKFPIWDDVRTFDGKPWRGVVDVVSGGFPCQDISSAACKIAKGIDGERSGLWKEMARIIGEVRPKYAFVENSPLLIRRGLTTVIGDLAEMGYDAAWGIVSAADCGAPHLRKRIWIVAHSSSKRPQREHQSGNSGEITSADRLMQPARGGSGVREWWQHEPAVGRVANGVARRVDRLRCIGNGQVPIVAATAWRKLIQLMGEE
jgi:DNA (cytosine-5)-methyltransferase 1